MIVRSSFACIRYSLYSSQPVRVPLPKLVVERRQFIPSTKLLAPSSRYGFEAVTDSSNPTRDASRRVSILPECNGCLDHRLI